MPIQAGTSRHTQMGPALAAASLTAVVADDDRTGAAQGPHAHWRSYGRYLKLLEREAWGGLFHHPNGGLAR